ncbi:MAG TPA: pyridoxamine 5'-phosphate oxidase family protein [Candidatus Binatia bacterium]|nr:pyridoxamine 5'-phosphate oxidase family protein [Candidatus Binatia bacterium]
MITNGFSRIVTTEAELREIVGSPSELALRKDIGALDQHARAFIAQSPFLLMATASAAGRCDVSPKGDAPGFVHVLDDRHLAVPDRPGNRRVDGMRNLVENPHIGLIFMIPGREDTLRVNGRAWIVRDDDLLTRMAVQGKRPLLAVGVEVEECFLHCAKAFKRSRLWQPADWPDPSAVACMAEMLVDQTKPGLTVAEMEHHLQEGYRTRLY